MLFELCVGDIMTTPVATIDVSAPIREAADTVAETSVGSLVICEHGRPDGIVTESDLVGVLAREFDPGGVDVGTVMSSPVITTTPTIPLERAASLFMVHDISKLPVVEGDTLVGMITTTDLSAYIPAIVTGDPSRHAPTEEDGPSPAGLAIDRDSWHASYRSASSGSHINRGDVVRFKKRITAADIDAFANASGDTARQYLDPGFARRTRFRGPIVPGALLTGLIGAAISRLPGLVVGIAMDIGYLSPAVVGSEFDARCTVVERLGSNRFRLRTMVFDESMTRCVAGTAAIVVDELPEAATGEN